MVLDLDSETLILSRMFSFQFSYRLTEGGQTALGPALHMSILLAGKVPGSKVYMWY